MGAGAQELSLGWARLAVEGSGLPIRVEGSRATTHLELRAVGGDPRELVVPVLHEQAAGPPDVLVDGGESGGSARFLGWIDPPPAALDSSLRGRSRPALDTDVSGAPAALLWILLGLGMLSFAARKSAWASLALAGLGGMLALQLGRGTPQEGPVPHRVLEGRLDGQRWLAVDVGTELELDSSWAVEHRVYPPDAPLEIRWTEGLGPAVMEVPAGCELVRRFERKRLEQDAVHHTVDRCVGADGDAQGQRRHRREARGPQQRAHRLSNLPPPLCHHRIPQPLSR